MIAISALNMTILAAIPFNRYSIRGFAKVIFENQLKGDFAAPTAAGGVRSASWRASVAVSCIISSLEVGVLS